MNGGPCTGYKLQNVVEDKAQCTVKKSCAKQESLSIFLAPRLAVLQDDANHNVLAHPAKICCAFNLHNPVDQRPSLQG